MFDKLAEIVEIKKQINLTHEEITDAIALLIVRLETILGFIDSLPKDDTVKTSPILQVRHTIIKSLLKAKLLELTRKFRPETHRIEIAFFTDRSVGIVSEVDFFEVYGADNKILPYQEEDSDILDNLYGYSDDSAGRYASLLEDCDIYGINEVSVYGLLKEYRDVQSL